MRIALGSSRGFVVSRQRHAQLVHTSDILSPQSVHIFFFFFKKKKGWSVCLTSSMSEFHVFLMV